MREDLRKSHDKLDEEREYSNRVRTEREDLRAKVKTQNEELLCLEEKCRDQTSTIQKLEKQVDEHIRGNQHRDALVKKDTTAALQGQLEKRLRAFIGDLDVVFKASGYVFDPAATSDSGSEDEKSVQKPTEDAAPTIPETVASSQCGSSGETTCVQ